jgi:hypothetical protein
LENDLASGIGAFGRQSKDSKSEIATGNMAIGGRSRRYPGIVHGFRFEKENLSSQI